MVAKKVLKCWKQIKGRTRWNKGDETVLVSKNFALGEGYELNAWDGVKFPVKYKISNKQFKTKTQALKSAKSYMKKHNTCKI